MARRETQRTKNIDVGRSFIPVDPNAFPENYNVVTSEDSPDRNKPVVAYEGHNFLPTPYGYKSYFGVNAELDINALTSRVDEVIVFQTQAYENIMVALCEDGIWTKRTNVVGAWTHAVVLPVPAEGYIRNWTHCVIGNELYCYRAQEGFYWKMSALTKFFVASDDASLLTGLTLSAGLGGLGLPAGTYSYSVAPIIAGVVGIATDTDSHTLAAAGSITLNFTTLPNVGTYRIYRTVEGITQYYDTNTTPVPTTAVPYIFSDNGGTIWLDLTNTPADYAVEEEAGVFYAVTPTFLNMAGQQGIFKAGGRLGFWDSANSIAWSNLDDFSDFTPAILTMAGNTIFQEILGKIVTVIGMAEDFVIYATKSILLIRQTESTSQIWASKLLVKGAGIILPREVAASTPDTTHFAYASNGLYKIEKGDANIIVPEVTDYLKESNLPVYLKVLEGRFLFVQLLDATYINGLVGTQEYTLPPVVYTFPTETLSPESISDIVLNYQQACIVLDSSSNGGMLVQQELAEGDRQATGDTVNYPPKKDDTFYLPIWTAFLSKGPVGGVVDWTTNPCNNVSLGGVPSMPMSPVGTLDPATRPALTANSSAYLDGWTIERFIQIQTALWEAEDRARQAWIDTVTNRVSPISEARVELGYHSGLPDGSSNGPAETLDVCTIGEVVDTFTAPVLRINPCKVSLFRMGISKIELDTFTRTWHEGEPDVRYGSKVGFSSDQPLLPYYESAGDCYAAIVASAAVGFPDNVNPSIRYSWIVTGGSADASGGITGAQAQPLTNGVPSGPIDPNWGVNCYTYEGYRSKRRSYNGIGGRVKVLLADEPYMTITGWKYTDANGVERIVPATTCTAPYPKPAPSDPDKMPPNAPPTINDSEVGGTSFVNSSDGSICGLPYEPVTIPGITTEPIQWYVPPLVTPPTSFLLQDGSIGPIYPTIPGALVYDLQLQKWGKMKQNYKVLVDYMPLNNSTANIVNYETFGMIGGLVLESGKIALFDENPIDSYIKYGKIGYYRTGFTKAEEVRVTFRGASSGTIQLETSLNGSIVESGLGKIEVFASATEVVFYPSSSGRWHNIKIQGNYDIKHLEFRGTIVGNR